ncbi:MULTISPECIES: 50S ribosomal protein L3 N(5)-glutamine methyltransferase [Eikenella]|uniref:Ribosomal protein uL3 glutamine methyltransferase n=1 Tax=Eikenella exigua TaxID=2528037 RepID=A0AAX1F6U3_9NEIS|nr:MULTISPECIES: 50S ribosomal protein L3 N(5)-glutamine methyltransferase [Eikenella]OAM40825.1 ribosomal protein L3 N(5)-glutamine methyltransferase [Eikenella sp. NML97-A-109]QED91694.1 50S ribosomal protein L3 N(5)-glutamine methyltransferase [Eikenella exigua]
MFAQARQHLRTPRDLLRFCTSRFNQARLSFGHGSDNAHDEAVYLILHTLHLPLDTLEPYLDAALLPEEIDAILSLAERRVNERLPMAYLTRQAWQGDFEFYVDERVLIPRSFIYEQLGEPIAPWTGDSNQIRRVLDLCTGSGCLAIQAACHYPEAQVDAADLSHEALAVAAINVANYGLEDRVRLIQSDLFTNLSGNYDLIISNPPYVNAESVAALPAEYLHEPEMALGSGEDGLDATRQILQHAPRFLNPRGVLLVEIGYNREALEAAFPQLPFFWPKQSDGGSSVFLLTREQLLGEE